MKQLNIKRLARTIKWNMQSSKKSYINLMAVAFFTFFAIQLFTMLPNVRATADVMKIIIISMVPMCVSMFYIFLLFSGCMIFSNMKTKQQRIAFKMLPATDLEKFLARFIYVTVFFYIGLVAAFVLVDLLRMLICLIIYHDTLFSMTPALFKLSASAFKLNDYFGDTCLLFFFWSAALLTHAFTILCGTIYRRNQVIFCIGTSIAVSFIVFIGYMALLFNIDTQVNRATAYNIVWAHAGLLTLLALLFYYLSYRIFKRMQVINNKWINL